MAGRTGVVVLCVCCVWGMVGCASRGGRTGGDDAQRDDSVRRDLDILLRTCHGIQLKAPAQDVSRHTAKGTWS